jgi:hypothetical protein
MHTICLHILHYFIAIYTIEFLPNRNTLDTKYRGNGFFYAYSRGFSPQTIIDEIVPKSLNVLVFAAEVKETF